MRRTRRQFVEGMLLATSGMPLLAPQAVSAQESPTAAPAHQNRADDGQPVVLRGRVVCFTEEFAKLHDIKPECEETRIIRGFKTSAGQLYSILPTDPAAAIYDDQRFRERELQITARLFAATTWLEVIRIQSVHAGRLYDIYYFCDVCNIRTHKPGPCECCQDPVVFQEDPADPVSP
jgi:hypothetical protein